MYGRDEGQWDELVVETIDYLADQARRAGTSTYTDLNRALAGPTGQLPFNFSREADRAAMGSLLGAAVDRTLSDVGAMISSIVMYLNVNDAGSGFYKLAAELGLLTPNASAIQKEAFWTDQVKKVHNHFALGR